MLKLYIVASGMTQLEVSQRSGVSAPDLSRAIKGHRRLAAWHLAALAEVLGVDQQLLSVDLTLPELVALAREKVRKGVRRRQATRSKRR